VAWNKHFTDTTRTPLWYRWKPPMQDHSVLHSVWNHLGIRQNAYHWMWTLVPSKLSVHFSRGCHYQYHHCHRHIRNGTQIECNGTRNFHKSYCNRYTQHCLNMTFMDVLLWGMHVCLCVQKERWMRTDVMELCNGLFCCQCPKPAYMS
jgi:hypothetical protein